MEATTTLRLSLRNCFRVYVMVALLVAFALFQRYSPDPRFQARIHSPVFHWALVVLNVALVVLIAYTLLRWWYERLVADENGFTTYDFLNRARPAVPFAGVRAYRPTKLGAWLLFEGTTRIRLPDVEPSELHRLIAKHAPKALGAKRLRGGLTPPAEACRALPLFDVRSFLEACLGASVIYLPFCLFAPKVGVVYVAVSVIQEGYRLLDLGGRLTIDDEGLRARWPWQSREIRWSEANAIFCEGTVRNRRFVVTSPTTAIVIPRQFAHELLVMRKVLYSLPSGTLCVNFDDSLRRGWRRRRRKRLLIGSPTYEPAFAPGI
jgi:hypothetical protein